MGMCVFVSVIWLHENKLSIWKIQLTKCSIVLNTFIFFYLGIFHQILEPNTLTQDISKICPVTQNYPYLFRSFFYLSIHLYISSQTFPEIWKFMLTFCMFLPHAILTSSLWQTPRIFGCSHNLEFQASSSTYSWGWLEVLPPVHTPDSKHCTSLKP